MPPLLKTRKRLEVVGEVLAASPELSELANRSKVDLDAGVPEVASASSEEVKREVLSAGTLEPLRPRRFA